MTYPMGAMLRVLAFAALILTPAILHADEPPDAVPLVRHGEASEPVPKNLDHHKGFVLEAQKGNIDLLFFGDSITEGWRGTPQWERFFGKDYKAANFGIGGDQTQHVLWRMLNGELDGIQPKVIVLMIGTNNGHPPEEIAGGIHRIIEVVHEKLPQTSILLLGIFPCDPLPDGAGRQKITAVNSIISTFDDDDDRVRYLDIGECFLQSDGSISVEIMPDHLHLSERGYELWGEAITPTIQELMIPPTAGQNGPSKP